MLWGSSWVVCCSLERWGVGHGHGGGVVTAASISSFMHSSLVQHTVVLRTDVRFPDVRREDYRRPVSSTVWRCFSVAMHTELRSWSSFTSTREWRKTGERLNCDLNKWYARLSNSCSCSTVLTWMETHQDFMCKKLATTFSNAHGVRLLI